ncbi:MAG: ATP-binding protein [Bacteroidales bacterium]|nr:ATP-binding protein [Bacteroidales bacterium]
MIIQFSVGNFRSFKKTFTLSLEASINKEHKENTFSAGGLNLLKTNVVFGANASGKSNLFNAFLFMRYFVGTSANNQITSPIPVEPFKLSTETEKKPSFFEVVIIHENIRYRYGFEANSEKVVSEWLFSYPKNKETKLFIREGNSIINVNKNKFKEGKSILIARTRPNALFLSLLGQFNGEISKKIISAFHSMNIISGLSNEGYINFSMDKLKDSSYKNKILDFIKSADINIEDFKTEQIKINPPQIFNEEARMQMPTELTNIKTIHKKFDKNGKLDSSVVFDLNSNESSGTQRLVFLSAPIIDTLEKGKVLFVDEMDISLHPLLLKKIIKLFNNKVTNPKNAQLIFNSHNTLMLCNELFRRDQIWFIQKNKYGASELYSLDDYSVRSNSSFEKDYLLGKFGAIPITQM